MTVVIVTVVIVTVAIVTVVIVTVVLVTCLLYTTDAADELTRVNTYHRHTNKHKQ